MSKRFLVKTVMLAMLLFIGVYQEGMALEDCQGKALMSVDESKSTQDKSLSNFIGDLRKAIEGNDALFIKEHLHPDIIITYPQYDKNGNEVEKSVSGSDKFMSKWNLKADKKDSSNQFWKTMKTILDLGGSFKDEKTYEAPYVHSKWSENCKRFEYVAIVGDVSVREKADLKANEIGKLSYVIVKADYSKASDNWVKITIPNVENKDKTGYVEAESIRSYYDYSVQFVKEGDKWLIKVCAEFPRINKGIPPCEPYYDGGKCK